MILTASNLISFIRGPAALLFLSESIALRTIAIVVAMTTDWLDGYLARRNNTITRLGTLLDPFMDKFFVCFLLVVFLMEGHLQLWEALTFLSRDFALLTFSGYLVMKGLWNKYKIHAFWYGKVFTTLQFILLLALTYQVAVPSYVYLLLIALGVPTFQELRSDCKTHLTQ